jgi:NAD(P)-dependent dehydrogenase (short-subunit alcohol dehydrogenase family)
LRLAGKVALVIGGTKGIGLGVAELFAEHGALSIVSGRDTEAGAEAVDGIVGRGLRAEFVAFDAVDLGALETVIKGAAERHGRLDVLVNNAGYAVPRSLLDSTVEEYDQLFDLNVRSVFFATKWGAESMIATGGGSVVNIASTAATRAWPNRAIYCATKGAVLQLSRAAALDVAGHGVRINCVSPGTIDTPLLRKTRFEGEPHQDELVAKLGSAQPIGRIGTPSDIAEAALYLASDESSWVTGANIVVDGGGAL